MFPGIPQKVAQKLLKKQSKVAFCDEICSKVARKYENLFFGLMLKYAKLYDKSKISKHFCAILVTSVAEQLCPQLKPKDVMIQ